MFGRFRIIGDSMQPELASGSQVLTLRLPYWCMRAGQIAVAQVSDGSHIVKRISRKDATSIVLASDNKAAHSQYCGVDLPISCIKGIVIAKFA